jgi:hypothetical protein
MMESAVSLRLSFGGGGGAEAAQVQSGLSFFSTGASPVGLSLMLSSMVGPELEVAAGLAVSVDMVLDRDNKVHCS